jgi:predicted phage tail protein
MTEVRLHGLLAREFGKSFRFNLDKAKDVVRAIDANKKNFTNRIVSLAKQGFAYTIVVDNKKISDLTELEINKKPEVIDIVPMIVGAGPILLPMLLAGGTTFLGAVGAVGVTKALTLAALAAITTGLQMALAPKPEAPEPISATTRALQESFTFSNKVNVAAQGTPVPVGFGRLKVGSKVVQFCLKSFPQNESSIKAMSANPFFLLDTNSSSDSSSITNRI